MTAGGLPSGPDLGRLAGRIRDLLSRTNHLTKESRVPDAPQDRPPSARPTAAPPATFVYTPRPEEPEDDVLVLTDPIEPAPAPPRPPAPPPAPPPVQAPPPQQAARPPTPRATAPTSPATLGTISVVMVDKGIGRFFYVVAGPTPGGGGSTEPLFASDNPEKIGAVVSRWAAMKVGEG